MVQINFALKEVNCKLVYYGPGLSGKTTNLEVVHSKAPANNVGELTSIATEGDRTLFFDFLPLNLGPVAGMTTKFQIYTVPGQVYYNSTRKLVLQGADGIVFVADSRRGKMDENLESYSNLEENLREYGMDISTIPLVLQYNKRDLPDVYGVSELEEKLNKHKAPYFEAVAVTGEGVFPTLKKLSQMVLESLNRQQASMAVKGQRKVSDTKEAAPAQASRARAQVPVAAMAGGGGGASAAGRSAAPAASAPAAREAKGHTQGKQGGRVIREHVSESPGVKAIERKAPGADAGVRRKASAVPAPAPKTDAAPKKSSGTLVAVVAVAAAAVIAAALYFAGVFG